MALAIVFLVGYTGFVLLEGRSNFDAVYMTVLTMTTVGYDELRPLSQSGRFLNLFLMLAGVGLMLYILTVTVQTVEKRDGQLLSSPAEEVALETGDRVVMAGDDDQ